MREMGLRERRMWYRPFGSRHHVRHFHCRDGELRRDGGHGLFREVAETLLGELDDVHEPVARPAHGRHGIRDHRRDGGGVLPGRGHGRAMGLR
jgi:hypothetical protein